MNLTDPADKIQDAAVLLAQLTTSARSDRLAARHDRAVALDREIAATHPQEQADITAHAFAVHYLTQVYGTSDAGLRSSMLRFIASHPAAEGATLQASRIAALLSCGPVHAYRMALLDHILITLGPGRHDTPHKEARVRDSALVLLLLDADASDADGAPSVGGVPEPAAAELSATRDRSAAGTINDRVFDAISAIFQGAERTTDVALADRARRYDFAVDNGSLNDAMSVVLEAIVEEDHDQAWRLLKDLADRHPGSDLTIVAPNVLGSVSLDGDGEFEGPGAGCFTILSPTPASVARAVTPVLERLMNVDDQGIEYADSEIPRSAGGYTANYVHDLRWCDHAVQVLLDTKGWMSAPMARGMLKILTATLTENRLAALITGYVPALDAALEPWTGKAED